MSQHIIYLYCVRAEGEGASEGWCRPDGADTRQLCRTMFSKDQIVQRHHSETPGGKSCVMAWKRWYVFLFSIGKHLYWWSLRTTWRTTILSTFLNWMETTDTMSFTWQGPFRNQAIQIILFKSLYTLFFLHQCHFVDGFVSPVCYVSSGSVGIETRFSTRPIESIRRASSYWNGKLLHSRILC